MNWYLEGLKKYATFSGRARRKEYWFFSLFNLIITLILIAVDLTTGTFSVKLGMGFLGGLYGVLAFLPTLTVTVRRLHDTDRSGWWLLFALVPIIGGITLFVFLVQDSKPGQNQFGTNPKEGLI